jgi:hypothetical protein
LEIGFVSGKTFMLRLHMHQIPRCSQPSAYLQAPVPHYSQAPCRDASPLSAPPPFTSFLILHARAQLLKPSPCMPLLNATATYHSYQFWCHLLPPLPRLQSPRSGSLTPRQRKTLCSLFGFIFQHFPLFRPFVLFILSSSRSEERRRTKFCCRRLEFLRRSDERRELATQTFRRFAATQRHFAYNLFF